MNICKIIRHFSMALGVILGVALLSTTAAAAPILSYGQSGADNTIIGTRTGSSTTIAATNASIIITQILGGSFTPALISFSFSNINAATITSGGDITQNFAGTFCITSLSGCGGTNYLSGTVVDVAIGSGAGLTLTGSTPVASNVTFTSSVIPAASLGLERGASFSFSNVTPGLSIVNGTINNFTAAGTGTFSAGAGVPEPGSFALIGAGLLALGAIQRRKK